MTREEILNMPAGREMDKLIAEKVMGWEWWHLNKRTNLSAPESAEVYLDAGWERGWADTPIRDFSLVPHYSTDIAAAWEVVEKMHKLIMEDSNLLVEEVNYLTLVCTGFTSYWSATFGVLFDDDEWFENSDDQWPLVAKAETAPLAICRAALLAVMGDAK